MFSYSTKYAHVVELEALNCLIFCFFKLIRQCCYYLYSETTRLQSVWKVINIYRKKVNFKTLQWISVLFLYTYRFAIFCTNYLSTVRIYFMYLHFRVFSGCLRKLLGRLNWPSPWTMNENALLTSMYLEGCVGCTQQCILQQW